MISLGRVAAFLIVLGINVLVHELGHFIAAKLMKIRVEVFSFGFGKRLFGRKIGQTDFRVSLFPVGGYVRLAGEEESDPDHPKPDEFLSKNRAQKIFTLALGPAMNLLLAVALIAVINMAGVEIESYKLEKPVIGYVEKDSPAEKAGLQRGDLILAINQKTISDWKELEIVIGTSPKENLPIDFLRDGSRRSTHVKVGALSKYELGYAGIYWNLPAEVETVADNYPAQKAGLVKGDMILAVDRHPVVNYFELKDIILRSANRTLWLTVSREGKSRDFAVVPRSERGTGVIGFTVHISTSTYRYGFSQALVRSVKESVRLTRLTFDAFKKMITGRLSPKNLSGPIEIAKFSQQALVSGLSNFFMLIAFISLQLGIINLFPIPGLDGGHLLIFIIEAVIRRDLNRKLKAILIYAGFSLLIALMVFVILNDVAKALPHGWGSILPFLK